MTDEAPKFQYYPKAKQLTHSIGKYPDAKIEVRGEGGTEDDS